jgi:hypothetical protein
VIYWMWEKKPRVIILIIILLCFVEILRARPTATALRGVNTKALLQARTADRPEEDFRSNTTLGFHLRTLSW